LKAPIPASFLDRLFAAASKSNAIERELAFVRSTIIPARKPYEFIWENKRLARTSLIDAMVVSSFTELSFFSGKSSTLLVLAFHYLYRPLRYTWHRLYYKLTGFIRRIRWRFDRLFLRINFRTH